MASVNLNTPSGLGSAAMSGLPGQMAGVDLSKGSYSQYETPPPAQDDSIMAAYNAAGLGRTQQDPFTQPKQQAQPQPQPDPNQPPAPAGQRDIGTKEQALTEEPPPPDPDNLATRRDVGRTSEEYDPYIGMEDTPENRARKASGFYRFTDQRGGEWWVDPWAADPESGVWGPKGATWNKATGEGLPNNVMEYFRNMTRWSDSGYGEGFVGNALSMYDQEVSSDERMDKVFGLTSRRSANGDFYLEIGEGSSRCIIIDGNLYRKEDLYNPNRVPVSDQEAVKFFFPVFLDAYLYKPSRVTVSDQEAAELFFPEFEKVWIDSIRGALSVARHVYSVGQLHGNPPPFRSGDPNDPGIPRNPVYGPDSKGDTIVDSNKNGIPDGAEGVTPPPDDASDTSDAIRKALGILTDNLGAEGDLATIKQTNEYEAGQAQRQLAQGMAGRGMADSGVAQEMGGQLGQGYARDLSTEIMKSQQQQNQNAMQVAQLMFGDKWQKLSMVQQEKMQKLLLKHQKSIAKYLNDLQQGNPGMIEAFFDDIWRAFGGD